MKIKLGVPIDFKISARYFDFNRQNAIIDVYDALVELITNSDDSYHHLFVSKHKNIDGGQILVEIEEKRKNNASKLIIHDKAEGMSLQDMTIKLTQVGERQSKEGDRGFMGRGAKDCTALGKMTVESIKNERYYKCELNKNSQFVPIEDGKNVDNTVRNTLRIKHGNGTVITLEIDPQFKIPHVDTIIRDLPWHYALRDMLSSQSPTELYLKNLNNISKKTEKLISLSPDGDLVCDKLIEVPGYPNIKVKLKIWRAKEPLEDPSDRFRRSGLLIKGKRTIYECSLLYSSFEKDFYAKRYFGRLECEYIDDLLNEYDERRKNNKPHTPENPSLIIDPNRQTGLRRDHPFVKALFQIPSEELKRLIEIDKGQDKASQKEIANKETQHRLSELAKVASRFLEQQVEDIEETTLDDAVDDDFFSKKGVLIFPTYLNIAIGQVRSLTFYVNRSLYDKEGKEVKITSDDSAVKIIDESFKLRAHPKRNDRLIGSFRIQGISLKEIVCLQTNCEGIPQAEAMVKVVENKIEEHQFNNSLEFEHKQYHIKEGSVKMLRIFAKYPELVAHETPVDIFSSDQEGIPIKGRCILVPIEGFNFAVGEISVQGRRHNGKAIINTTLNNEKTQCHIKVIQKDESGAPIKIKIVSRNLGVYRAAWSLQETNVLEISAVHESIKRYLGPEPDYEGQDTPLFHVLLAEIVAERICMKALELEVKSRPWDFKDDFNGSPEIVLNTVVSHLQKRLKDFVARAHKVMLEEL
ncbi:MAG: ATP-binding protein [Candidatus Roizmanbacteria bacterium]|nr:ATP-binding protein [Candidatus Roizmanbacteria bacterium]